MLLNDCKSDEKCATSNKKNNFPKENFRCAHVRLFAIKLCIYLVGLTTTFKRDRNE